jgi:hypothetical protein
MEEKRSCHSMHSLRSTRSHLTRPTSDISYIDDEDRARKGSSQATNGHYIRASTHGMSNNYAAKQPMVVEASSNYLKVEGGAYRVQRSNSSASNSVAVTNSSTTTATQSNSGGKTSSDASTQSVQSSCTQTDDSFLTPSSNSINTQNNFGSMMQHPQMAPPSPVPPVLLEGRSGSAGAAVYGFTRATSPTPPTSYSHAIPSPFYHPPYYDPTYYHTYLNPMLATGLPDGYQYEVVVRRPSMGPTELTVPVPTSVVDPNMRRPSVGHYALPPIFPNPQQLQHSLPGSFESSQGPPLTPVYNPNGSSQQQPSLQSPRHFPSTMAVATSVAVANNSPQPLLTTVGGGLILTGAQPIPSTTLPDASGPHPSGLNAPTSNPPTAIPGGEPTGGSTTKPIQIPTSDIQKLIHETSI